VRFVVFLAVAVLVVIVLLSLLRREPLRAGGAPRRPTDELVKDPVCQTYVVRSRAVRGRDRREDSPYFCSEECARRYAG
jgi:YHS domain-containing protein